MNERLLIVDDDAFMRSVTEELLQEAGYAVTGSEDGLDAWQRLEEYSEPFDLILLDWQMPRMDGMELLQRLKADARFRELPVVMLTGHDRQQEIAAGLAAGAYYYLTKPSPENVLRCVIRNALQDVRQKRELRQQIGQKTMALHLLRQAEFQLQTLPEAEKISLLLAEVSQQPERTIGGYSELLINAIEHGNLGISYAEKSQLVLSGIWRQEVETRLQQPPYRERKVTVRLENSSEMCMVTIIDQGAGFNWQPYLEFSTERAFDLHGRGVAMSKAGSFDGLEYQGNGNTVVTRVLRNR
ncbi:response regulator [Candidatus Magnetaquicoccus inordinatus]|uniref:response regulator n=1 Tax=Candidatus Magnetaquicoccus inordinatus TaxID=2496818 RepID=UPI00102B7A74|nr:response regulator [Candidatus Magnetaquicoccus inordinatus]